jgi:hypothetical protein
MEFRLLGPIEIVTDQQPGGSSGSPAGSRLGDAATSGEQCGVGAPA